jgi:hypothetical protein
MKRRTPFSEYIRIKNIRRGPTDGEGKSVSFFFGLVVGPFVFPNANYVWKTQSIHLNSRPAKLKANYVKYLRPIIEAAFTQWRDDAKSEE